MYVVIITIMTFMSKRIRSHHPVRLALCNNTDTWSIGWGSV